MEFSKKQNAFFYIEKNKGTLYVNGVAKPYVVTFPKDVFNNLEVGDITKFGQVLTNFITKHELKPMQVFIVLSRDVTFEKELDNIPLSLQHAEEEKFLEMVPLHHVITKTYNFSSKTIIVAANKDLCTNSIATFQENLFPVLGVIPLSILEEKLSQLKNDFDATLILKKIENLKHYYLPVALEHQERMFTREVPSFKNVQFVALLSIFSLLLLILGIQLYVQVLPSFSKSNPKKAVVVLRHAHVVTPTPTPTVSPTPEGE